MHVYVHRVSKLAYILVTYYITYLWYVTHTRNLFILQSCIDVYDMIDDTLLLPVLASPAMWYWGMW